MSLADERRGEETSKRPQGPALHVDVSADGGEFTGFVTENPLAPDEYEDAFAKVYRLAGLSPADHRIVDDTVRFSVYQQSANTNGVRDLITLYAYRARFQRISALDRHTEAVVHELTERLRARKFAKFAARRTPGGGLGPECSYVVGFSDWQLGKPATREGDPGGTGVEQTTLRVERAIDESKIRIKNLRRVGRNVTGITLAHMGDPTENVADSYPSQPFDIELNLVQQMEVALRLMVAGCEELLPLAEKRDVLFVLCNHGQMSRRGTKTNITDDSDNVQNHLARLLKDWIVGPRFTDVNWHIPGEQMITTATIGGVPIAAAHGHKIAGAKAQWLLKQTANLQARRGIAPRVWWTAHKHSQTTADYGAIHDIQFATADGGSKNFEDISGIYSTPGTTSFLQGNHDERGFSDVELI